MPPPSDWDTSAIGLFLCRFLLRRLRPLTAPPPPADCFFVAACSTSTCHTAPCSIQVLTSSWIWLNSPFHTEKYLAVDLKGIAWPENIYEKFKATWFEMEVSFVHEA